MESDSDFFYEYNSDNEQGVAGSLNIQVNLNMEESPESPPPGSPAPVPPQQIPVEEPAPGWELPDDGSNFLNCFTRQDVLDLKNWALWRPGRG